MKKVIIAVLAIIGGPLAGTDLHAAIVRSLGPPAQQNISVSVPDTGGTFLLLAAAFIVLVAFRYRFAK